MDRIEEEKDIDVYIDGSCINNGKMNTKAGYGVFFAHDDVRNESNVVEGKQTNNTGELTAMIRALEILKKEISWILNGYKNKRKNFFFFCFY